MMTKVSKRNYAFRFLLILTLGLLSLVLTNCRKDLVDNPPQERGSNYYPLGLGHSWTYRVDSISYDNFEKSIDTSTYYVLLRIEDSLLGSMGWGYRTVKYLRRDTTEKWQFDREVFMFRNSEIALYNEQNEPIVKLSFPLTLYNFWDGNLFNSSEEETFEIVDVHSPYLSQTLQTDSSVSVIHRDETNALQRFYGEEIYANGIGMVYKKEIEKLSTSIGQDIPNGFDYTYELIEFEK